MKLPSFLRFLDADCASAPIDVLKNESHSSRFSRWMPFIVLHLCCGFVFVVGVSQEALLLCLSLYLVRMFAITGFYHRYFSHRSFKTSRLVQFVFAFIGASSVQRGPLWWASHHRHHHKFSDTVDDIHSPAATDFLWSHIGWITSERNIPTDYSRVEDLCKFPELVWLNRFDWLPGIVLSVLVYVFGEYSALNGAPTSGLQFLVWGLISTIVLYHATFAINSVSHIWGSQRFDTGDDSKNNAILALLTLGEGWHNNHHRFPGSTKQGYAWWEVDITYGVLKGLEFLGVVWDVSSNHRLLEAGVEKIPLAQGVEVE